MALPLSPIPSDSSSGATSGGGGTASAPGTTGSIVWTGSAGKGPDPMMLLAAGLLVWWLLKGRKK